MTGTSRNSTSSRRRCGVGTSPSLIVLRPGHPLSNTERFWLEYATRPRPKRLHSVSHNAKLACALTPSRQNNKTAYVQCRRLIRKTRRTVWRNHHKVAALVVAAVVVVGTVMLAPKAMTNTETYINLPPPALLTNYTRQGGRAVPHWLYRHSSYSVLGLTDPLIQSLVPPAEEVGTAFRTMSWWHPNKWQRNGLTQFEAHNIWAVIREAYSRFEFYYKSPKCSNRYYREGGGLTGPVNARQTEDGYEVDAGIFDDLPTLTECCWTVAVQRAFTAPFTTPEAHEKQRLVDDQIELGPCSLSQQVTASQMALCNSRNTPGFVGRYWCCPTLRASWNPFLQVLGLVKYPWHYQPKYWSKDAKEKYKEYLHNEGINPKTFCRPKGT